MILITCIYHNYDEYHMDYYPLYNYLDKDTLYQIRILISSHFIAFFHAIFYNLWLESLYCNKVPSAPLRIDNKRRGPFVRASVYWGLLIPLRITHMYYIPLNS